MNEKIKIIVAGIGGVGGYFGGLLAKHFEGSSDAEIHFLARGQHLERIRNSGLKVLKGNDMFIAKPKLATDNSTEIGAADLIIICTKSYDLKSVTEQIKPCLGSETFVLPLLNGVENSETIKNILPGSTVLRGCVYVISHIKEAGVIENAGNIQKLYFGLDGLINDKLLLFEKLLRQAGIEATLSENISSLVWEKFHLVGANSTATSYFDCTTGEILADKTKTEFLFSLLEEVNKVALAKGVRLDKDIVSETMAKLRALPFENTSSMHRDFKSAKGKTELETITGYVIRSGRQLNVPTPTFETAYNKLSRKYETV